MRVVPRVNDYPSRNTGKAVFRDFFALHARKSRPPKTVADGKAAGSREPNEGEPPVGNRRRESRQ